MYDLIMKKRDGKKLNKEEIDFFIKGYTDGSIPDYQASALLMAIFLKGMDDKEATDLTMAMTKSGDMIDLSKIHGIKVDKHSTGGVGDTTTMVLAPMVAACDVPVAKMSGRGLGHTGGTIDKLESFNGFQTSLTVDEFIEAVNKIKIAVVGQTGKIAPADKKIYALRDVTATVDSIPLIAASIMSKKLAAGSDAIVLDVKVGSGAFMKTLEDARKLASLMVSIGKNMNRKICAVITNMDQPLSELIGNSLEIISAIETLKGKGSKDLYDLCLTLGSYMLLFAERVSSLEEARKLLDEGVKSGKAIEKMKEFVKMQKGDYLAVDDYTRLPQYKKIVEIKSENDGFIQKIHAEKVGIASMILGAGRKTKEDVIDLGVGIEITKKINDQVKKGDVIGKFYVNDESKISDAEKMFRSAYSFSDKKGEEFKLILDIID
jgi:pyrimidine-nucleoside phosphorylase